MHLIYLDICSLKRHAIVSRNCRDDIEFSKRKEDLNLMVEKMLHPYNNECECNLKFSSHATLNKSITVQIDNPQNVLNSKKFSWWKRTKNKIRKKKKQEDDSIWRKDRKRLKICEGGIFQVTFTFFFSLVLYLFSNLPQI